MEIDCIKIFFIYLLGFKPALFSLRNDKFLTKKAGIFIIMRVKVSADSTEY